MTVKKKKSLFTLLQALNACYFSPISLPALYCHKFFIFAKIHFKMSAFFPVMWNLLYYTFYNTVMLLSFKIWEKWEKQIDVKIKTNYLWFHYPDGTNLLAYIFPAFFSFLPSFLPSKSMRAHAHVWQGRVRERGRKRIPSRLHAISAEPSTRFGPTDYEIMTWSEIELDA